MFSGRGAHDLKTWLEGEAETARSNEDLHMVGRTAHRALEQMRNLALKNTIGAEPDGIEIALRSSRVFAFSGDDLPENHCLPSR